MTLIDTTTSTESADLLESLRTHRGFLLHTVRGLDDEQARRRTTVSALCLGGLVKHVTATERQWAGFIVEGAPAMATGADGQDEWADGFSLVGGETLAEVVAEYEAVAARTDELVTSLPDLGASHELPAAPWFAPGARWSARRVLLHLVAETAQHAGHADILRESLDGQKTMG
ncbi:MAG TPA: DinB family protein [Actinomycetales bacterium]|jgi:uncharacterized damage-inducible protein DinB